jgi:ubiquinone/menaquinone biosynthesis C-methylase UbiE
MSTFDSVSGMYEKKSLVQKKAAEKLVELLRVKNTDAVIDIACGPGHITNRLSKLTNAKTVGIDISEGMIEQAKASYPEIEFRNIAVENLDYNNVFNIAFCNSALQWFSEPEKSLKAVCRALKRGGRLGVACPATASWAPFFSKVLAKITKLPDFEPFFANWKYPWFILKTAEDCEALFKKCGFQMKYISVDYETNCYSAEEAFEVYLSGAANGLNSQKYYGVRINDDYVRKLNEKVKEEFFNNAINGKVILDFNRLYYIGEKT